MRRATLATLTCMTPVLLSLAAPNLSGDSWMFEKGIKEDRFQCGETQIVRVVDATEDQTWPHAWIEIRRNQDLVKTLDNLSFDDLAMSADCGIFLGISNSGVPRSAVVLFTAQGELIQAIEHSSETGLPYCQFSVTVARTWYDRDEPAVEFEYSKTGDLEEVTVRSCEGERIGLGQLLGLAPESNADESS